MNASDAGRSSTPACTAQSTFIDLATSKPRWVADCTFPSDMPHYVHSDGEGLAWTGNPTAEVNAVSDDASDQTP